MVPMAMEGAGDDGGGKSGKLLRREREMRRRAARSSLVQTLAQELEGAPVEIRESAAGGESAFVAREAERLARRAAEEEDLFTRVPMSKVERKRAAAAANKSIGMSSQVADFGDDLADLMEAAEQLDTVRGQSRALSLRCPVTMIWLCDWRLILNHFVSVLGAQSDAPFPFGKVAFGSRVSE